MISIIVPVYNEEKVLPELYGRIRKAAATWGDPFELILVNDGSADGSLGIMKEWAKQDAQLVVVNLSRNFGHQAAVSAGIAQAEGDAVVIMDADLQDPPEVVGMFLEKWREGYEVVYAIRTRRKEHWWKKTSYFLFYRILSFISDIPIPLDTGDFCVMDKKVVNVLKRELPENIRFIRGLRAFAGFKQIGLTYERDSRLAGESKYTFKKLMSLALDGIFGFSTFPLRIATYLGFFISLPSFLIGVFFIVHRIFNFKILGYSPSDTPGLATLAVGMFFLGGIMLLILGILGYYLGRIYIEVKKRPQYIVDEVFGAAAQQEVPQNKKPLP